MNAAVDAGSTLGHNGSAADACRERGWTVGTRLIGDEGYGPTVIEITALGEAEMLAKCLGHAGGAVHPHEDGWELWCRDWRIATDDEIPAPIEAGEQVEFTDREERVVATVVKGPDEQGCYVVVCDERRFTVPFPARASQEAEQ